MKGRRGRNGPKSEKADFFGRLFASSPFNMAGSFSGHTRRQEPRRDGRHGSNLFAVSALDRVAHGRRSETGILYCVSVGSRMVEPRSLGGLGR